MCRYGSSGINRLVEDGELTPEQADSFREYTRLAAQTKKEQRMRLAGDVFGDVMTTKKRKTIVDELPTMQKHSIIVEPIAHSLQIIGASEDSSSETDIDMPETITLPKTGKLYGIWASIDSYIRIVADILMSRINEAKFPEDMYDLPNSPLILTMENTPNGYFEPSTPTRSVLDDAFPNTPSFATFDDLPSQENHTNVFFEEDCIPPTEERADEPSILDLEFGDACMVDLPPISEREDPAPSLTPEQMRALLADYERLQEENKEIPKLQKKVKKLNTNLNGIRKVQKESTKYFYSGKTRSGSNNLNRL